MSVGKGKRSGRRIHKVGRFRVDIDAIWGIAHCCRAELCKKMRGCCEVYDVSVTHEELSCIIGMVEAGKGFYAGLDSHSRCQEFFEEDEGGVFSLAADENMRCVLAYRSRHGLRCYLHSVALRLKLNPYRTKPQACAIWPLAVSDGRRPALGVQESAFSFPCNRRRPARRALDEGIEQIIREVFGETFLGQLKDVAAAQRHRGNAAPGELLAGKGKAGKSGSRAL